MFFEASQPVAKSCPCARLCVCVSFILQSSLFVIVVQEKRLLEYWLCLRAGNRNRSSTVTCFTGTHGGGTSGNSQTPIHFPTNMPWKLFLGGTLLPIHFLFGSSQIAFHFDKLWGVFLLLFVLILLQFQLNKKTISVNHFCICPLNISVFVCEETYLFEGFSSLHELDLKV